MQEKNISRKKIKAHEKYTAKELPKLTQAFNKYSEHPRAKLMQCTSPRLSTPAGSFPALLYHVLPTRSLATSARQTSMKSSLRPICSPLLLLLLAPGTPSPGFPPNSLRPLLPGLQTDGSPHRAKLRTVPGPSTRTAQGISLLGRLLPPSHPAARLVTVLTAAPYTLPDPTPPPRPTATALPQAPALCHRTRR